MSDPNQSPSDEPQFRILAPQSTARREILGGLALGLGGPLMIVAGITVDGGDWQYFNWQDLGAWVFLMSVPTLVIAVVIAIIPSTRRGGLGMLLGSGLLLLFSWITCSMR